MEGSSSPSTPAASSTAATTAAAATSSTAATTAAVASSEQQSLAECEDYVQRHSIQQILKECIVQLCVARPDNPVAFLREYFQKLERVSACSRSRLQSLGIRSQNLLTFELEMARKSR